MSKLSQPTPTNENKRKKHRAKEITDEYRTWLTDRNGSLENSSGGLGDIDVGKNMKGNTRPNTRTSMFKGNEKTSHE
jgi:hypothetical protein